MGCLMRTSADSLLTAGGHECRDRQAIDVRFHELAITAFRRRCYSTLRRFLARSYAPIVGAICATVAVSESVGAQRPWVSQDSIATHYFASDYKRPNSRYARTNAQRPASVNAIAASPDGKYFFVIRSWGDLQDDVSVSELSVYSCSAVQGWISDHAKQDAAAIALRQIRLKSSSPRSAAIEEARWDSSKHAILFLSVTEDGAQELRRLDISSGSIERVVQRSYRYPSQVTWFVSSAGSVLFEDSVPRSLPVTRYPGELVERRTNGTIWREAELLAAMEERTQWIAYRGRGLRPLTGMKIDPRYLWLSPDGRIAIGIQSVKNRIGELQSRYFMLDLERATEAWMPELYGEQSWRGIALPALHAFWSADSSRAILVNAVLPSEQPTSLPSIFELEVRTGKLKRLERVREESTILVDSASWLKMGEELLVTHRNRESSTTGTIYAFTSSGLIARPLSIKGEVQRDITPENGISLRLAQGSNQLPRIVVSNEEDESELLGPQILPKTLSMVRTEPFSWQEPDGRMAFGMLTLPHKERHNRALPLVIQAYYADPKFFSPDGPHAAVDAAQTLAARGVAVMQIELPWESVHSWITGVSASTEGSAILARVQSVISTLARAGITDQARVAMTGFSRGGYETYYTIAHAGHLRLAAAVAADFFHGSYSEYLSDAAAFFASDERAFEGGPGKPFWSDKLRWFDYETTFNADLVRTPLLMTLHGSELRFGEDFSAPYATRTLETIGLFAFNRKPVEYLYLPTASHVLGRPGEKFALMEVVVDWLSFWLQGYTDPSPHKAVQYARWQALLKERNANESRQR